MVEKYQISVPLVLIPSSKRPSTLVFQQAGGREREGPEVSGQVPQERVCSQGTDGDPDRQVHRYIRQMRKREYTGRGAAPGRGKG